MKNRMMLMMGLMGIAGIVFWMRDRDAEAK